MEPTNSQSGNDEQPDYAPDEQRVSPAKPKLSASQQLQKNWMAIAGAAVLLLFFGLFLWLRAAKQQDAQNAEPVAAASTNIEAEIPSLEAAPPPAIAAPSVQMEAQRRADAQQKQQQGIPAQSTDNIAEVFAVDTTGRALRLKRHALAAARRNEALRLAAAADVDTIETTIQDPATGSYRSEALVVPRHRVAAAGSAGGRAGGRVAGRSGLPDRDTDGTPFETDPSVLSMLGSSPPETRLAYERMTGKRYRDPTQAAQMIATSGVNAPGMDGFNTVKTGNASRLMAQGSQQQMLVPDVFYKCVINGQQKVRTGSVVILRLIEDAVVSGVTFPKNTVFASVANVGTNSVNLTVNRLGPTRVEAQIFDFNYMPGIMIDPNKKVPKELDGVGTDLRSQSTQELSTAIDRSASAANSLTGVAGRIGATMLGRRSTTTKLRDVLLPDGYPILITTATAGQMGPQASAGASR